MESPEQTYPEPVTFTDLADGLSSWGTTELLLNLAVAFKKGDELKAVMEKRVRKLFGEPERSTEPEPTSKVGAFKSRLHDRARDLRNSPLYRTITGRN